MTQQPLKAMREAAGLSTREVARRVESIHGIPMNSGRVSLIERGLQTTEEERRAIAAVLGAALTAQPETAA